MDKVNQIYEFHRLFKERSGWLYERSQAKSYGLPDLCFKPDKRYALLISQHLQVSLEPGLLSEYINPLTKRIEQFNNYS